MPAPIESSSPCRLCAKRKPCGISTRSPPPRAEIVRTYRTYVLEGDAASAPGARRGGQISEGREGFSRHRRPPGADGASPSKTCLETLWGDGGQSPVPLRPSISGKAPHRPMSRRRPLVAQIAEVALDVLDVDVRRD